jgi:hypothetical protein
VTAQVLPSMWDDCVTYAWSNLLMLVALLAMSARNTKRMPDQTLAKLAKG